MRMFMMLLLTLAVLPSHVLALTKPVDVRDYNLTYDGVLDTGTLDYRSDNPPDFSPATLYRDNQDGGVLCGCGMEGESYGSHPGVDIPCAVGTVVLNIAQGDVLYAGYDANGWGWYVVMEHNIPNIGMIYSIYAHLSSVSVATGNQNIAEGATLGLSGSSGNSTGPHLHFQIDRDVSLDGDNINHPYWRPNPDPAQYTNKQVVHLLDPLHEIEYSTINPMPFLQMTDPNTGQEYTPSFVPVGFVLNSDYSGNPSWRTSGVDGVSQAFRDRYDLFFTNNGTALGFPWDNIPKDENGQPTLPYGQAVHKVDDMWIQDLFDPNVMVDDFDPNTDVPLTLPYTALIKGEAETGSVRLLKEGFWDWWINNAGWEDVGYPVTDEYVASGDTQQTFRKNGVSTVYVWDDVTQTVTFEELSGIALNAYNITFTSGSAKAAKAGGDGIYHSGLSVTDLDVPIKMVENRTHDSFYAMLAGQQIAIDPFTVTGDMTIVVNPAPSAEFTATVTAGSFPLNVQFSNQSTGNPTSWSWDFGDGSTSTLQHPNHTYTSVGNYTVSLTASNASGSDTMIKTNYIQVVAPVIASFSHSSPDGYWKPALVDFLDTSSGNPTSWSWNFDDGSTSTLQHPSHTYVLSGDYTVTLIASNAYGSSTAYMLFQIKENTVPDFTADVTTGLAPLTVQFTDQSTGGIMDLWAWDFGDGGGSCCTTQNPVYTYNTPGLYSVRLDAQNQYNSSEYIIKTEYITVVDPSGCTGNGAYHFNGINQYLTVSVLVGDVLGNETTVEAWVRLDRNNVEQNIYSYWNVDPHKMFNLYVDNTGHLVGERYGVTPSSATGSTVLTVDEWHYLVMVSKHGDPTKIYVDGVLDGTSAIALDTPNVTNALLGTMAVQNFNGTYINYLEGALDEIRVSTVARTATDISNYYTSGSELTVDANTITLWHMNGDVGTTGKMVDEETSIPRDLSERYNPQVTSGFNECLPLVANFNANPISGQSSLTVQFTDQSDGNPISWAWDVNNDGTVDYTTQNPIHTYTPVGYYTVSLTVSDGINVDTITRTDYITVNGSGGGGKIHPYEEPNPFNPSISIYFKVDTPGHLSIKVYDLMGRQVAILANEYFAKGVHSRSWTANGVASGVYFYQIQSIDGTHVRKITVMK